MNGRFDALERTRIEAVVRLAAVVLPGVVSLLAGADAGATTDTTFAAPLTTVTDMVGGTVGQLAAVLAVGAALVGSVLVGSVLVGSVLRFNATQIMGAMGVGVQRLRGVNKVLRAIARVAHAQGGDPGGRQR